MSFIRAYLEFIMIVLFVYLGIGIAFVAERLRYDPEVQIRKALTLTITWGKYLVKGNSNR